MPTALITGITGQDGSYLAEFLLTKGYNKFRFLAQNTFRRKNRAYPLHSMRFQQPPRHALLWELRLSFRKDRTIPCA